MCQSAIAEEPGRITVAPVLFGKPFDGIVAVLTILRGDIGEVTLRVELLNFALFPTNAVVSFVLQPGPLIVVIVHFVNSCIFSCVTFNYGFARHNLHHSCRKVASL